MPKKNGTSKPSVKVQDLRAMKNPKGGAHKHIGNVKYEDLQVKSSTIK